MDPKSSHARDWRKIAVLVHTAVVGAMGGLVAFQIHAGSYDYPVVMWVLFAVLDFPVGLAISIGFWYVPDFGLPGYFSDVLVPGALFAVFGGLQWWWFMGLATGHWSAKPMLGCPHCGHDLRGSQEFGRCSECGRQFEAAEVKPSTTLEDGAGD